MRRVAYDVIESQCEIKITENDYRLIISSILKPCFLGGGGAVAEDVVEAGEAHDDVVVDVAGRGFRNPGGTEGE